MGFMCTLFPVNPLPAQRLDSHLAGEVTSIRADLASSNLALRQYTWTEHTEVLVNGKLQFASDAACRYDATGQVVKSPLSISKDQAPANGVSKRPIVRKKAEKQDYIQRAISLIGHYFPPDPEQLDLMLARGDASLEQSEPGKSQVRFIDYYQRSDSIIFSYDPVSKALLLVTVLSTLGSPKDPVRMEAVFETLPGGVNHLGSTTLTAKSRKIEVKTRNISYTKVN